MPRYNVQATFDEIRNKLIAAKKAQISCEVEGSKTNVLYDLTASISGGAAVAAGYDSGEWSSMSHEKERAPSQRHLPNARLHSFRVQVTYRGTLLSSESVFDVDEFVGHPGTTAKDVESHLTNQVLRNITTFIGKSKFLGRSITDTVGSAAGFALGGVGGSMVGVAAVDSIKGAVTAGKAERGVGEHSSYQVSPGLFFHRLDGFSALTHSAFSS
jgi:hypothetical protein